MLQTIVICGTKTLNGSHEGISISVGLQVEKSWPFICLYKQMVSPVQRNDHVDEFSLVFSISIVLCDGIVRWRVIGSHRERNPTSTLQLFTYVRIGVKSAYIWKPARMFRHNPRTTYSFEKKPEPEEKVKKMVQQGQMSSTKHK